MANKDFRLTAILAVRDTMSPVMKAVSDKWRGFQKAVDTTEFQGLKKNLALANRSLKNFGDEAKNLASEIGAPFMMLAGSVGFSLQSAVTDFSQTGDALDKMSARLGISAEQLQEWSYAATHAGAAPEDLEDALKDLSEKIAEVAAGDTGDAAQLFEALGISVKDATGKIRPSADIFREVADAIQRNENPAIRTKMAMVLMGDSGRKLIPMLSSGSAGLEQMGQQAHELGLVMSQDAITAAAAMTDHVDDMKASVKGLGNDIGARLAPIVIKMSDRFRDLITANRGAFSEKTAKVAGQFADSLERVDFEGIAGGMLTIADYGLRAFNALGGFNTVLYVTGAILASKTVMSVVSLGSSLIGVAQSLGTAMTAVKTFGAVASASLGPVGWIIGALSIGAGLVIANWDRVGPAVKDAVGGMVDFVGNAFTVCQEKFGAVGGAILESATGLFRGDMARLFGGLDDLAIASFNLLPDAWAKGAKKWYEGVKGTVTGIGRMIKDYFADFDFKSLIPDMSDMVPKGVKNFFGFGKRDEEEGRPKPPDDRRMPRYGFGEPVSYAPAAANGGRMSGEMVVRVEAAGGATASLVSADGDGLDIKGSVGRSDRAGGDEYAF